MCVLYIKIFLTRKKWTLCQSLVLSLCQRSDELRDVTAHCRLSEYGQVCPSVSRHRKPSERRRPSADAGLEGIKTSWRVPAIPAHLRQCGDAPAPAAAPPPPPPPPCQTSSDYLHLGFLSCAEPHCFAPLVQLHTAWKHYVVVVVAVGEAVGCCEE